MVPTPPEFVEESVCKERHRSTTRSITITNWLIGIFVAVLLATLSASAAAWKEAGAAAGAQRQHEAVQAAESKHTAETLDRIEKQSEHQHEVLQEILAKIGGP